MSVSFHEYQIAGLRPFFMATNDSAQDGYTDWIRTGHAGDSKTAFINTVCEPGTKFIDLGANIGLYALPAAAGGAQVLAVEGLPSNYSVLVQSIVRNQFRNITAVHAAIFDTTGVLHMGGHSAWGYVSPEPGSIEVPSVTIDDLCEAYDFCDAKLMKIDIEGSEISAFDGASRLLRQNRDLMIIFENNLWGCWNQNHRLPDLLEKVEAKGFDLYLFHEKNLVPRKPGDFQESVFVDYLAVPNGVTPAVSGFEVRHLSPDERAAIILKQAAMPEVAHRAYVLGTKGNMPLEVRDRPDVDAALRTLEMDISEEFVSAVQSFVRAR